jgi:hypothetical protein
MKKTYEAPTAMVSGEVVAGLANQPTGRSKQVV